MAVTLGATAWRLGSAEQVVDQADPVGLDRASAEAVVGQPAFLGQGDQASRPEEREEQLARFAAEVRPLLGSRA